jgi:hypothetical protein
MSRLHKSAYLLAMTSLPCMNPQLARLWMNQSLSLAMETHPSPQNQTSILSTRIAHPLRVPSSLRTPRPPPHQHQPPHGHGMRMTLFSRHNRQLLIRLGARQSSLRSYALTVTYASLRAQTLSQRRLLHQYFLRRILLLVPLLQLRLMRPCGHHQHLLLSCVSQSPQCRPIPPQHLFPFFGPSPRLLRITRTSLHILTHAIGQVLSTCVPPNRSRPFQQQMRTPRYPLACLRLSWSRLPHSPPWAAHPPRTQRRASAARSYAKGCALLVVIPASVGVVAAARCRRRLRSPGTRAV